EFFHPLFAPSRHRAARGKDEGANIGYGTFQWTPAVKVLTAYLLRCAAWGRRGTGEQFPTLEGFRTTRAATLNYAMSKKTGWVCDMFGTAPGSNGRPYLLDLIRRSNPDFKREGEPVVLRLDETELAARQIVVMVGDRRLEDPTEIARIADTLDAS